MGKGKKTSRRQFLHKAAGTVATFTIVPRHVLGAGVTPPSEKLNIACIGVGGRGGNNLKGVSGENIVALCDVDMRRAARAFKNYPRAKHYRDFRKMLDEMDNQIDAVVVSTPDHTHAVASMEAIKRGKHVYCEKPLGHTIQSRNNTQQSVFFFTLLFDNIKKHTISTFGSFCQFYIDWV